ncbi:MAG: YraN family protein [Marinobacter sp.]|nr:YraN family protein [Marinobacter sp.]
MTSKAKHLKDGENAETAAAAFLRSKGLVVLERNYRCKLGELDLIAREGGTLVFVEVRFRSDGSLCNPLESITPAKQRKTVRAAMTYLQRHQLFDSPCRIDVISVQPGRLKKYHIEWIKNAIEAT